MSTALAPVQYKPTELSTESLGAVLVKSGYFADTRDVAQAIVKVLAGKELGFGPIASMQGVYIVKGRVTLSANLVGAAIQRSGKYAYAVKELTNDRCTLIFKTTLVGGGTFESTFTIQDAQQAGIAGDTYKKFPRNMLFSRALTNGARWFCPEVFNGPIYTPDELGAIVEVDGRVVDGDTGEVIDQVPAEPKVLKPRVRDEVYARYMEVYEQAEKLELELDETWSISETATIKEIADLGVRLKKRVEEANEEAPF